MDELLQEQEYLQTAAAGVLTQTPLLELLSRLGTPIQTGSSVTGLMVYPDIDFTVQAERPDFKDAVNLIPEIMRSLKASAIKIANFVGDANESASYYIGFEFPFEKRTWHIDATITRPGPITTNPPELEEWLRRMNTIERIVLLGLKKELIEANRYAGARSQPPFTFRSVHVYEAVLKGNARSVTDIETYFKSTAR